MPLSKLNIVLRLGFRFDNNDRFASDWLAYCCAGRQSVHSLYSYFHSVAIKVFSFVFLLNAVLRLRFPTKYASDWLAYCCAGRLCVRGLRLDALHLPPHLPHLLLRPPPPHPPQREDGQPLCGGTAGVHGAPPQVFTWDIFQVLIPFIFIFTTVDKCFVLQYSQKLKKIILVGSPINPGKLLVCDGITVLHGIFRIFEIEVALPPPA